MTGIGTSCENFNRADRHTGCAGIGYNGSEYETFEKWLRRGSKSFSHGIRYGLEYAWNQ
jgi:hypothetical protein